MTPWRSLRLCGENPNLDKTEIRSTKFEIRISNFQTYMKKTADQNPNLDAKTLKREVIVETYRSSGPGGQRKNKTETAIRLKHLPSGMTVVATEHRSQAQNKKLAFERLRERLLRLNRPRRRRIPTPVPLRAVEKTKEKKRIRSAKKRLRQKPQKAWEGWE